jgi:hypothetical protein
MEAAYEIIIKSGNVRKYTRTDSKQISSILEAVLEKEKKTGYPPPEKIRFRPWGLQKGKK